MIEFKLQIMSQRCPVKLFALCLLITVATAAALATGCSGSDHSPISTGFSGSSFAGEVTGGSSAAGTGGDTFAPISGGSGAIGSTANGQGGGRSVGGSAAGGTTTSDMPTTGGTVSGGATGNIGATSAGGASQRGGATSAGGASQRGGATSAGGASQRGGATSAGGTSQRGGATAIGGSSANGASTSTAACPYTGHVTYILAKATAPTADQQASYDKINSAMDAAVSYYNCYTNITKSLNVSYVPSVATADGNSNGSIRFGSQASMNRVTAMHEISHTVGIGTAPNWASFVVGGKFTGASANAQLLAIPNRLADTIGADTQHFWPYGLNYESEGQNQADLLGHCQMVMAIRKDLGM